MLLPEVKPSLRYQACKDGPLAGAVLSRSYATLIVRQLPSATRLVLKPLPVMR